MFPLPPEPFRMEVGVTYAFYDFCAPTYGNSSASQNGPDVVETVNTGVFQTRRRRGQGMSAVSPAVGQGGHSGNKQTREADEYKNA